LPVTRESIMKMYRRVKPGNDNRYQPNTL